MKYLRIFLAVLLVPVVVSFVLEFLNISTDLLARVSVTTVPFWIGIFSYFIFQIIFEKPLKTYVFGHELTHAIFGLLNGARVKSFKVSASGGSVILTKTGVIVALSPYFVPLYSIIAIAVYFVISRFIDVRPFNLYFLFIVGFTVSFHIALTYYAISRGQSDLKQFGVFFSFLFVVLVNCIILSLILKIVLPYDVNLMAYFYHSLGGTFTIWQSLYVFGTKLWATFQLTK